MLQGGKLTRVNTVDLLWCSHFLTSQLNIMYILIITSHGCVDIDELNDYDND